MKNKSDARAWTREDIKHLLISMDYLTSQPGAMSEERRAGFLDALTTIALVAGIDPPDIWQRTDAIFEGQK